MPKFALNFPYFIIMICLLVSLVGMVNIAQMPVDLFPGSTCRLWLWRRSTTACRRSRLKPT